MQNGKKSWWKQWFGSRSERAVAAYLKKSGFRIAVRNFTCPHGEIDLIAIDGDYIVFVEVRSTEAGDLEKTAASIDFIKQRKLSRSATYFLKHRKLLDHAARFDVVVVRWPEGSKTPVIEHHQNAFEAQ